MRDHETPSGKWEACPPGTLRDLSRKEIARQTTLKRARVIQAAAAAGILIGCVLLAGWGLSKKGSLNTDDGAVAWNCNQVLANIDNYFDNSLDSPERDIVHEHLRKCNHCQQQYRVKAEQLGLEFSLARLVPMMKWTANAALIAACPR